MGSASGDRPDGARLAYEAIAPVYDAFTADHDYDLWLDNLLPKIEQHLPLNGRRLLDVACGTGKSFLPLLERGWSVTACDISPSMAEKAEEKAEGRATIWIADMRYLPIFGDHDVVLCADDAMNYLLSIEEMEQTLGGMRSNLSAHGLLVFDLNTLHSFRTFFAEEVVVEKDGLDMIWSGLGDPEAPPRITAQARFEVRPKDPRQPPPVPTALHQERHFPEGDVLAALDKSGLEAVAVYGHHYDAVLRHPLDEEAHTKAVYFARKAGA